MTTRLTKSLIAAVGALLIAPNTYAADITKALRENSDVNSESENYFEIGVTLVAGKGPSITSTDSDFASAGLVANGSYSWKGLFISANGERGNYLELGYNAYDLENWSFDLVLIPTFAGSRYDNDEPHLVGLDKRSGAGMLGGRLTGSFQGNIVQFSLYHDVTSNSHGTTASALAGRNWQYRNWNFHAMSGFDYADARHINYYTGITDAEASRTSYISYKPGARLGFIAELGVTYPISEDWVFRATSRYGTRIGSSETSPILLNDRSDAMLLSTSITYVF